MDNSLTNKINEIRERADIVDIISRHVNVVRKGKNYFALCPFHNDNNPSMSVSKEKQIYKCFVCNEAGNVFTFIQKYKKIPYLEAVKEVADSLGMDFDYKSSNPTDIINPKIKVLYDILKDANRYYSSCLSANEKALLYCKNRQIEKKIIDEFKIGYSDDNDKLIKFLLAKGYLKEDIYRSGIALENNGELKDRFANRLIFPITDIKGNVVAFSGRIIEQSDMAKYVNSPETEIFVKGNTLYHYADALQEIKKNKSLYVCEGFMDVIALCKANIYNAVALMGTAFTKEHLKLFKYLGVDIILTMDGDIPGNVNANKLANALTELQVPVKIIPHYKDVKDVDEYLKKYGEESLINHLNKESISSFDFDFYVAAKTSNLNNNEDKKNFLKMMCFKISKLDDVDKDIYVEKLNKELGFSRTVILNLIKESSEKINSKEIINDYKKELKKDKMIDIQLRILTQMLDSTEAIEAYIEQMIYLKEDAFRKIANIISEYYKENKETYNQDHMIANLYTKVSNEYNSEESLMKTLSLIDDVKEDYPEYSAKYFDDLLFNVKEIMPIEDRLNKITDEFKFTDIEEQKKLIDETLRLKKLIKTKKENRNKNL